MLSILRRIVAEPPPPANTGPGLTRDAALRHIFELDPEAGRALIVHEATDPRARPSIGLIKLLPAPDIARIVKTVLDGLANRSAAARDLDYELLDSYADASALDVAKNVAEGNPDWLSCGSGPSLLRYLLRVDPAYGAKQVQAALNSRKESLCYKYLLQSLGDQLPAAQEVVIKALDDPDPDRCPGKRSWSGTLTNFTRGGSQSVETAAKSSRPGVNGRIGASARCRNRHRHSLALPAGQAHTPRRARNIFRIKAPTSALDQRMGHEYRSH